MGRWPKRNRTAVPPASGRRRGFAILIGCVVALLISQGAMASTTTTTFPTILRQPPQQHVHLANKLPPLPTIRAALTRQYRSAIPLLNEGFESLNPLITTGTESGLQTFTTFNRRPLVRIPPILAVCFRAIRITSSRASQAP